MTIGSLPVPLAGQGVCEVCRASSTSYARCYSCNQILRQLELGSTYPVPTVLPLALAVKKSPLARALWDYKRSTSPSERSSAAAELATFVDARLPHLMDHVGYVDTVTFVPSRKNRQNPVQSLLEETEWGSATLVEDVLDVLDTDSDTHLPDAHRFDARDLDYQHILLIDDTFTRGATAFSAARALYEAGALEVTVVVLGRHTDVEWSGDEYLSTARGRADRGEFCPECSAQVAAEDAAQLAHNRWDDRDDWDSQEPPEDAWEPPEVNIGAAYEDPWPASDPWTDEPARVTPTAPRRQSAPPVPASRKSPTQHTSDRGPGRVSHASAADPIMDANEPLRLSESAALTLTAILAAPFAIVIVLPMLLSNIGISLNPMDRYGDLWGPAGFNGYVTFVVFALAAGGVNWLLKSIHLAGAIALFAVASIGVVALFIAPLIGTTAETSSGSREAPTNARQFRAVVNEQATDRGVETITLGEARNAIESVCPAVDNGLTIPEARSQIESYADQQDIPETVVQKLSLMTELVIEFSNTLC